MKVTKSLHAVKQKLRRLGLKVVTIKNSEGTTTSNSELILPEDLPSIEEALLKLAAAMKALENPKLTKTDVMRLRTLIQTSTIYQKKLAEYIDYRRIERKLVETDELFERLKKDREEKETIKQKEINIRRSRRTYEKNVAVLLLLGVYVTVALSFSV